MLTSSLINEIMKNELDGFIEDGKTVTLIHGHYNTWISDAENSTLMCIDTDDKLIDINHFNANINEYTKIVNEFVKYYINMDYQLIVKTFDEMYQYSKEFDVNTGEVLSNDNDELEFDNDIDELEATDLDKYEFDDELTSDEIDDMFDKVLNDILEFDKA